MVVSSTCISSKIGKPRMSHQCRVCGDIIQAGESCEIYRGVEDGVGFYTLYLHQDCHEYTADWDDTDWETMAPGRISRDEIRAEMGGDDE